MVHWWLEEKKVYKQDQIILEIVFLFPSTTLVGYYLNQVLFLLHIVLIHSWHDQSDSWRIYLKSKISPRSLVNGPGPGFFSCLVVSQCFQMISPQPPFLLLHSNDPSPLIQHPGAPFFFHFHSKRQIFVPRIKVCDNIEQLLNTTFIISHTQIRTNNLLNPFIRW